MKELNDGVLYFMINKPQGCVTARSDAVHRTVMDLFPPALAEKLHPVGRLDKETCGLLILTDDGDLDRRIMLPGKHIPKTYFFYALGEFDEEKKRMIENGVKMSGYTTAKAVFEYGSTFRISELEQFMPEERRGRYMRFPDGPAFSASVTITEGKKHEVRLMLEAVRCRIFYLRRDRIGQLSLDKALRPGEYRRLTEEEVGLLRGR